MKNVELFCGDALDVLTYLIEQHWVDVTKERLSNL